jgi:hypothetical protein
MRICTPYNSNFLRTSMIMVQNIFNTQVYKIVDMVSLPIRTHIIQSPDKRNLPLLQWWW